MTVTIYVSLLDEGTVVFRPASAEVLHGDVFRITGSPADDTESWEFVSGETVRCREHLFADGQRVLVAYERFAA
jgi:hypothetical protein